MSAKTSLPVFEPKIKKAKHKTSNGSEMEQTDTKPESAVFGKIIDGIVGVYEIYKIARYILLIIAGITVLVLVVIPSIKQKISDADYWTAYGQYENKVIDIKTIGDVTTDGEYFEMGQWRGEPIVWRVLEVRDGQALVITEEILRIMQYDGLEEYGERLADNDDYDYWSAHVSWKDSDIRMWLNGEFISNAFSQKEAALILKSDIKTPIYTDGGTFDNPAEFGTITTEDSVFLLSADEAEKYFASKGDRVARFVMTQEDVDDIMRICDEDLSYMQEDLDSQRLHYEKLIGNTVAKDWWLRFSQNTLDIDFAAITETPGRVSYSSYPYDDGGVRPAMRIDLSAQKDL